MGRPTRLQQRAKENKEIRREALREELKSREYLRQVHLLLKKLDSKALNRTDIQRIKVKLDGLFSLLRKTLPDLKAVEIEAAFREPEADRASLEALLKRFGVDPGSIGSESTAGDQVH